MNSDHLAGDSRTYVDGARRGPKYNVFTTYLGEVFILILVACMWLEAVKTARED